MITVPAYPFARERTRHERATLAAVVLVAASFLFGGQSVDLTFVQTVPQLLGVLVLAWLGWSSRPSDFAPGSVAALAIAGAALVLIVAQLVPLPYGWWSAPPGRETVVAAMRLAGPGRPWHALSEDPGATLQSALMLLPALAMLALGLTLDREGLRRVMLAVIACTLVSLLFGTVQLMAGVESPLYVYGQPEARLSLGLFSNRNHQADAMCLALLMAGAAQYGLAPRIAWIRDHRLLTAAVVTGVFGLGVLFTASRTGMALFVPCAALNLTVAVFDSSRRKTSWSGRLTLAAVPLLVIAIGWAGFAVLAERMQSFRDLRFTIWPDAWYLAQTVWPAGTGFGTFELAYQRIESLAGVTPLVANAAHDDYLQLLIEGGAPAIALVAAFLGWFGWQVTRLIRHGRGMTGWFAAAGILLLLVHSAIDYPLRTEALSTVFAALCAILNAARLPAPVAAPRHFEAPIVTAGG